MTTQEQIHLYGREWMEPEVKLLHAGPLTVLLEEGGLRYLKIGDCEIIRGIYVAVRDRNWGTIPNRIAAMRVEDDGDRFSVRYQVRNYSGEIDFVWDGIIEGNPDGSLLFRMEGKTLRDFESNRIGFCILYPPQYAGMPCRVLTVDQSGRTLPTTAFFPETVAPYQPFTDLKSFSHQVMSGRWARIDFEGGAFEMEDQRNWTDASFKIYAPPLRDPFPVTYQQGQRFSQTLRLRLEEDDYRPSPIPQAAASQLSSRPVITIGLRSNGAVCPFGFTINETGDGPALSLIEEGLKPSHLRLDLALDQTEWVAKLTRGEQIAHRFKTGLWLVLKTPDDQLPSNLAEILTAMTRRPERIMITRNRPPWETSETMIERLHQVLAETNLYPLIGGGTDAWFVQLNRKRPRLDRLDFVFWGITPQVHAFDNRSLVETFAGQQATVLSARHFSGNLPLVVSPVTLRPRFNPFPRAVKVAIPSDRIPSTTDPRHWGMFGAVWIIGGLKALSEAGAESVTWCELTGPRGLASQKTVCPQTAYDGNPIAKLYPIFHIFKEFRKLQGMPIRETISSHPLEVGALALDHRSGMTVFICNYTSRTQLVQIAGLFPGNTPPARSIETTLMSEADWDLIISNPHYTFKKWDVDLRNNQLKIKLPPVSVAKIVLNGIAQD